MHELITIPEEEELSSQLQMEEEAARRASGRLTDEEREDSFYSAYEGEVLGGILCEPDPFEDDYEVLMEQEYGPYSYHPWYDDDDDRYMNY